MRAALLISPDPDLRRSVELATESIKTCSCVWINCWDCDLDVILDISPSLLVIHVDSRSWKDSNALPLLESLKLKQYNLPVVAVLDSYDGPVCKELLQAGVRECLSRPLDIRRLTFLIEMELLGRYSSQELDVASEDSADAYSDTLCKAKRVAATKTTILLTGETGVGKTHLAKTIHDNSPNAQHPFITLNCGAISEYLAESELFGHRKGAFTGADENYEGHFAASGKGTLFLDEVDSLSLGVQSKLLRTLDDQLYEAVGSVETKRLESRLIAASYHPLEEAVTAGRFRSDLYYRLSVVELWIPPLRDRMNQFDELLLTLLHDLCQIYGTSVPELSPAAMRQLRLHSWPGNIRELRNALEHAILFSDHNLITPKNLPKLRCLSSSSDSSSTVTEPEKSTDSLKIARQKGEASKLMEVLTKCNNNKAQAARELGISRTGLYKKIKGLGLQF